MPSDRELKVISLCCYLTDGLAWQNPRQVDHDALKMVKALKGDTINGYFQRSHGRYTDENKHVFAEERVPEFMLAALQMHIKTRAIIVPVPNSHVINVNSQNFKTLELAQRVCNLSNGQFQTKPLLVFRKPQIKARNGGPRFASSVAPEYVVTGATRSPIILLDDVLTTGGHMVAACRRLEAQSSLPILGITFGHTVHEQRPDPIGIHETEFPIDPITSF